MELTKIQKKFLAQGKIERLLDDAFLPIFSEISPNEPVIRSYTFPVGGRLDSMDDRNHMTSIANTDHLSGNTIKLKFLHELLKNVQKNENYYVSDIKVSIERGVSRLLIDGFPKPCLLRIDVDLPFGADGSDIFDFMVFVNAQCAEEGEVENVESIGLDEYQ